MVFLGCAIVQMENPDFKSGVGCFVNRIVCSAGARLKTSLGGFAKKVTGQLSDTDKCWSSELVLNGSIIGERLFPLLSKSL